MSDFIVTNEIQSCVDAVVNGEKFIFLTGVAGTGKSQTLKYLMNLPELRKKNTVVLAPTAVAAINVGGQTIHSFCKLERGVLDANRLKKNSMVAGLCKHVHLLIIDEISMVRSDLFDAMNATFKINRGNSKFFGGIQVLMVGDLFQLPPIINERNGEREALSHLGYNADVPFFFGSKSMNEEELRIIELTKVFRQSDLAFVKLLSKVRNGSIEYDEMQGINMSCSKNHHLEKHDESIIVATRNDIVKNENERKIAELKSRSMVYKAEVKGKFREEDAPSPPYLELKVGAKVMFTRNGPDYINGTIGIVINLETDKVHVESGDTFITVEAAKWESYEYTLSEGSIDKKLSGSFKQIPLTLGYAVTIHKSQGKTFEKVVIDLGNGAFASGQLYVALSRCKTLEGIHLRKAIRKYDIIVNPQVAEFCRERM